MIKSFFVFIFFIGFLSFAANNTVVFAQSCTIPAQVSNVAITFPSCTGDVCNFTQGQCTWGSVSGATNYQVKITKTETNTVVSDQQVSSSTTSITFPVTESSTYKCDVSAVNACGTGTAGTSSLLCKVDAAVTTGPTQAQVAPTARPVATRAPVPVTGSPTTLLYYGFGGALLVLSGFIIILLL
jgi:hypothetical protein